MVGPLPCKLSQLLHLAFPAGHGLMSPPGEMFRKGIVNMVLNGVDDAYDPFRGKGGIQVHHILGQELFPEPLVFKQSPDHQGGPVRGWANHSRSHWWQM